MQEKSTLTAPIAIIVAGVLIAGAIIFKDAPRDSANGDGDKNPAANLLKKDTIAEEVGLDKKAFAECLASGRHAARVESDYQSGIKAGVQGTPGSFAVNKTTGKIYAIEGAQPKERIIATIEAAIAGDDKTAVKVELDSPHEGDHNYNDQVFLGEEENSVYVIEYSDLECPFCKRFHEAMLEVMKEFDTRGQEVTWIYRHFPLDQIHSQARKEAEATECAAELGGNEAFWNYTNKLFEITPSNDGLDLKLL